MGNIHRASKQVETAETESVHIKVIKAILGLLLNHRGSPAEEHVSWRSS